MFGKWEVRELVYQTISHLFPLESIRELKNESLYLVYLTIICRRRGDQLSGNIRQDEVEVNIPR